MAKHTHRHVKADAAELAYEMPAELDFAKLREIPGGFEGMRRHAAAEREKRSVLLAPDVAKLFPTADAVNAALRLVGLLREIGKPKSKRSA